MTASLARTKVTSGSKPTCQPAEQITTRESFNNRGEWISQAHCRNVDPDELFVKGAAQRKAVAICRHCPVVLQCRADALDNKVEFGVWGGMTERSCWSRASSSSVRQLVTSGRSTPGRRPAGPSRGCSGRRRRARRARRQVLAHAPQPGQVVDVARLRGDLDDRHRRVGALEALLQAGLTRRQGGPVGVQPQHRGGERAVAALLQRLRGSQRPLGGQPRRR